MSKDKDQQVPLESLPSNVLATIFNFFGGTDPRKAEKALEILSFRAMGGDQESRKLIDDIDADNKKDF